VYSLANFRPSLEGPQDGPLLLIAIAAGGHARTRGEWLQIAPMTATPCVQARVRSTFQRRR